MNEQRNMKPSCHKLYLFCSKDKNISVKVIIYRQNYRNERKYLGQLHHNYSGTYSILTRRGFSNRSQREIFNIWLHYYLYSNADYFFLLLRNESFVTVLLQLCDADVHEQRGGRDTGSIFGQKVDVTVAWGQNTRKG